MMFEMIELFIKFVLKIAFRFHVQPLHRSAISNAECKKCQINR